MSPQNIPTDEVQRLASAGRSEKEIVSTLRQQGYSNEQISKALNRVLKFTVGGDVPSGRGPPPPPGSHGSPRRGRRDEGPDFDRDMEPPPGDFPEPGRGGDFQVESEAEPYAPMEMEQLPSGDQNVIEMTAEEEIALEELIEEIINEKWRDVEADLADLDRLYNASMDRMDKIEAQIENTMQGHHAERSDLQETLEETATQLQSIQGRVNSLERAFKEFLPELTDNIRELAEIVNDMQEKSTKHKRAASKDEMQTDGGSEEAYCVKCKETRAMKDTREERTKNDRRALKGECTQCGTRMSKFLKEK